MAESEARLVPEVDVACAACGQAAADEICSAEQLVRQAEIARRFHTARLRRRSRAALEERASFTHGYATRLLACRACRLLYRSPRPAAGALLDAYEGERYAAERLPQMVASQRALFRPKARALARSLRSAARVLEVGSFVGGFLWAAREAGLDAVGIDPSEQLSSLCRRSGLRVARCTLEQAADSSAESHYDAVAIWNTFDQFPRPREALRAVLRLLRPGGLVLLRFPHGSYFRHLAHWDPVQVRALAWNNLLAFPYLHGYGLRSLDGLVREFGLTRIGVEGDTLGAVADASYARWARLEESTVKLAQRARWARDLSLAPWLDVALRDTRVASSAASATLSTSAGSGVGERKHRGARRLRVAPVSQTKGKP